MGRVPGMTKKSKNYNQRSQYDRHQHNRCYGKKCSYLMDPLCILQFWFQLVRISSLIIIFVLFVAKNMDNT
jgi:hypothetical protein